MTVCEVCGGEEFHEEDGHFYCIVCQTQSQDVRVIEMDTDHFADWCGHTNLLRNKNQTDERKKKPADDRGRPWSIYELFQIILLEQVEALIKLGAAPQLKDLVFKLWRNYLSKLGVAFSDGPLLPVLQKYGRQREMFPGTLADARTKNILARKRMKKSGAITTKTAKTIMERDELSQAFGGETFYAGDDPLLDEGNSDDGYSTNEEDKIELNGKNRKSLKDKRIERMCMAYTLCLCYLGITHTNPATTLSDILCWASEGTVPYTQVKQFVPSHFKFSLQDWQLLGQGSIPSLMTLRMHTGRMAYFLGLSEFPETPMCQLISKYIMQLNLPAEMHTLAIRLHNMRRVMRRYAPTRLMKVVPFWSGIAMAHIIVVLKLILGLDDHTERLFSMYSKELMDLIDHSHQLFVWDDWVNHMKEYAYTANIPDCSNSAARTDHIAAEIQTTQDNVLYESTIYRIYQPERRQNIQKPFQELSKRWAQEETTVAHSIGDETFDITTNTLDSNDPVGHLLGYYDGEDSVSCPSTSQPEKMCHKSKSGGLHFRKCSIQHLIEPESYLEELDRHGLADYTILTSCTDTAESDSDGDDEFGSSPRKRLKQDHGRDYLSYRKFVVENVLPTPTVATIRNKQRYDFIVEQMKNISYNFLISFDYKQMEGKLSFDWLLTICSGMIRCDKNCLRDEVRKLEVVLFAEHSDFKSGKQHIFNQLKRSVSSNHYAKRLKVFH